MTDHSQFAPAASAAGASSSPVEEAPGPFVEAVTDLLSPLGCHRRHSLLPRALKQFRCPPLRHPRPPEKLPRLAIHRPVATESAAPTSATSAGATAIPTDFFHSAAPWLAGRLYTVVPPAPLGPSPALDHTDKWFTITRGRYVGLTTNSAISLNAVTGVPGGLSEKLATQAEALQHFNDALAANAIAIL
ncbi:hypothetical protein B0H14DRAFT_3438113 [Mycena olivaceomarginata]|nr:hypothetical protein B0H14DRAFT_3438113 [Mycena olivaceomarginata]